MIVRSFKELLLCIIGKRNRGSLISRGERGSDYTLWAQVGVSFVYMYITMNQSYLMVVVVVIFKLE